MGGQLPEIVGGGWRPPGVRGRSVSPRRPQCWGGVPKQSQSAPLTMITATTMAAMPMRYSFPEKSSSIFPWQSSCRGGQRAVRGARPPTPQGSSRGPMEGHSPAPRAPQKRCERRLVSAWCEQQACQRHPPVLRDHEAPSGQGWPREARAPSTRGSEVTTAPRQSSPNSSHRTAQHDRGLREPREARPPPRTQGAAAQRGNHHAP